MNQIKIENNKHLGIIFQPRSGSHVLRQYLSMLLNRIDLGEWYNVYVDQSSKNMIIENNKVHYINQSAITRPPKSYLEEKSRVVDNIKLLRDVSNVEQYGISTINSTSFVENGWKDILELIAQEKNMQFICLDRADVLYSLISMRLSLYDEFHNSSNTAKVRNFEPIELKMNFLIHHLQAYIENKDAVNEYFGNLPTIYYEQYQFKVSNILNLFTGIPKKIVGLGLNKWQGNHKDLISNIDEVEDYYEKFVNKHPEYFPQYFGKLPHITIPASQGRQPNTAG